MYSKDQKQTAEVTKTRWQSVTEIEGSRIHVVMHWMEEFNFGMEEQMTKYEQGWNSKRFSQYILGS